MTESAIGKVCPRDKRGEPLAHVVSKNLHRRHLAEGQRALVAGKIADMKSGARTDLAPIGARSRADVAQMLNVSERSVTRAKIAQWRLGDNQHGGSANRPTLPDAAKLLNVSECSISRAGTGVAPDKKLALQ